MSEINITIAETVRDTRSLVALAETYLGHAETILNAGAGATHGGKCKATAYTDAAGRDALRLEFGLPDRTRTAVEGIAEVIAHERKKDPASGDAGASLRLKARATAKKTMLRGW